jgi:hypothetical protein
MVVPGHVPPVYRGDRSLQTTRACAANSPDLPKPRGVIDHEAFSIFACGAKDLNSDATNHNRSEVARNWSGMLSGVACERCTPSESISVGCRRAQRVVER